MFGVNFLCRSVKLITSRPVHHSHEEQSALFISVATFNALEYCLLLISYLCLALVFCANFCWRSWFAVPITSIAALSGNQTLALFHLSPCELKKYFTLIICGNLMCFFSVHMTVELACISQRSWSFTAELLPSKFFVFLFSLLFLH